MKTNFGIPFAAISIFVWQACRKPARRLAMRPKNVPDLLQKQEQKTAWKTALPHGFRGLAAIKQGANGSGFQRRQGMNGLLMNADGRGAK